MIPSAEADPIHERLFRVNKNLPSPELFFARRSGTLGLPSSVAPAQDWLSRAVQLSIRARACGGREIVRRSLGAADAAHVLIRCGRSIYSRGPTSRFTTRRQP